MGIFPQQSSTFFHIIASQSVKDDQTVPNSQIRSILEAEKHFEGEEVAVDESTESFKIPILPNKLGMTSFWQMHEAGLRVLVDTMLSNIQFYRIIKEQKDVGELLEQEDPSMIKFIESSLQESQAAQKIESIDLPVNTHIVTFRSESATLNLKEIQ